MRETHPPLPPPPYRRYEDASFFLEVSPALYDAGVRSVEDLKNSSPDGMTLEILGDQCCSFSYVQTNAMIKELNTEREKNGLPLLSYGGGAAGDLARVKELYNDTNAKSVAACPVEGRAWRRRPARE